MNYNSDSSCSLEPTPHREKSQKWNIAVVLVTLATMGSIAWASRLSNFANDNIVPSKLHTDETIMESKEEMLSMPNFVFVLADDLGWNSIGYEDFDLSFATPTLTNLAKDGLILTNYYAQEVCTPSRGALLTGRYPLSIGMQYGVVQTDTAWGLNLNETVLAEVLHDNGYKTHIVGKWHLGHHSPLYLPTSRGFDTFTGYMDGDNFYFSKRNPTLSTFHDFMTANRECYYTYNNDDLHNYSTHLYRDLAVKIIEQHDQTEPLFLYVPFQAVHDPFEEINHRMLSEEFIDPIIYQQLQSSVQGEKRKQYGMALSLLDNAVSKIVDALEATGMMNNTYLIFASDNGGCFRGGGKNGPLRGTKGTLFEGGTKVDAFVYSPFVGSSLTGSKYDQLMHVSDWFPTILGLAGVEYTAPEGYELDGISHHEAWYSVDTGPRGYLLYNSYFDVESRHFGRFTDQVFAIRNDRYKLIHAYNNSWYSKWYDTGDILDDDTEMDGNECLTAEANRGSYYYGLYDLLEDPYEENNLYDTTGDPVLMDVKTQLYSQLSVYENNSRTDTSESHEAQAMASIAWKKAGNYIVPYVDETTGKQDVNYKSYPTYCGPSYAAPTAAPSHSHSPTHEPTDEPTQHFIEQPTQNPTRPPTSKPNIKPSQAPTHSHGPTIQPTDA